MRVYVPATTTDLHAERLSARWAHAVTTALAGELPDADEEELEMVATLAAADESVGLLADSGAAPLRVVVAADVDDGRVDLPEVLGEDQLPSAVLLNAPVEWADVVAFLVDERDAADDVRRAAAGDDEALERAADRDLLWYDAVELDDLRRLG